MSVKRGVRFLALMVFVFGVVVLLAQSSIRELRGRAEDEFVRQRSEALKAFSSGSASLEDPVYVVDDKGAVRALTHAASTGNVEHLRSFFTATPGGVRRGDTFWVYGPSRSGEIILSGTPYEEVIQWTRGFEAKETRNVILVMTAFGVFTLVWMWADHRAVVATQRARMVDELERMVHERTEALKRMNRLAKLGEFAASLAHEIRNPLGAVVTAARLLPDAVNREQEELVEVLQRESDRLDRVLKDFLSFSRDPQPVIRPTSLNSLVRRSLEILRRTEDFNEVTVEYALAPRLKAIPVDPDQMEQVFSNIALNGAHAMEHGGTLKVSTRLNRPWAEVVFRDEGHGISEEKRERIFEPFYTEKQRGTGLGLSIASRIVVSHGGFLQVNSKVGSWTEFIVSLPIESDGKHADT